MIIIRRRLNDQNTEVFGNNFTVCGCRGYCVSRIMKEGIRKNCIHSSICPETEDIIGSAYREKDEMKDFQRLRTQKNNALLSVIRDYNGQLVRGNPLTAEESLEVFE